ncbi:metallophosphoesterase [Candidatus Bathyarchaeota archaeon]|nr:metallophosphoesterase [Candidatus Bathyarchaeota archaeon]
MKIALAADFHLGYRQFNSRERLQDYIDAFIKVIKKVKEADVDVFVIAGDIFDKSRPHPGLIRKFLKETSRLKCPILLIRGNHDSPRVLFEKYGGDTLHLINDVSKIIYLDRKNSTFIKDDVCFVGVGYESCNTPHEIKRQIESVKTNASKKIGIFHQLMDFPGVPEDRADVSRGFLRNLGLDIILTGHFHLPYSESGLFNPGSPEYWSFDQGECITVNLDTGETTTKPAKKNGFFIIETDTGKGDFVEIEPARPMFFLTYETENFSEAVHLPKIRDYLEKYNFKGSMIKTLVKGQSKHVRTNLKDLTLGEPLVYKTSSLLKHIGPLPTQADVSRVFSEYLSDNGINKITAKSIVEWLENNKEQLGILKEGEMLQALRNILNSKKVY